MNSKEPLFLGLDLGTTNVKAAAVDTAGEVRARGAQAVKLYHGENGSVEQDLEEIWHATISALREVAAGVRPEQVASLGVSSQGGAMQVFEGRQTKGRVISWLDKSGSPFAAKLDGEMGIEWFSERIGHRGAGLAAGQLLRLREGGAGFPSSEHRIGFVGDSIVSRLCGRGAHDGTSASLTLLYDPNERRYEPRLLARLGLEAGHLPEILGARTPAGHLLPEIAFETGLPGGIPVSAAIHDQYAAALGAGALVPGTTLLGTGTAWVLLAVSERLGPPVGNTGFVCHHLEDGLFGQLLSMVNGGSALDWMLALVGLGASSLDEIDNLLELAGPGADGLSFWPLLAPKAPAGLRTGGQGRFEGLKLSHRPAHFLRAVIEGLAYELKRHLQLLESAGVHVKELLMTGKAGSSRVTPQIVSDVTGLLVSCIGGESGSVFGAALLARGLIERRRTLPELARESARSVNVFSPRQAAPFYVAGFPEYISRLGSPPPLT